MADAESATSAMTPELVAILGVGVALLAIQVASAQRTDRRIEGLETRMGATWSSAWRGWRGLLDGVREGPFERAGRQN